MTKPKPLDLEELKEMQLKAYPLKTEIDEEARKIIIELYKELKQRLKSAINFYLRYKDKPELLIEEHPEYKENMIKNCSIITCVGILSGGLRLLSNEKEIIMLEKYNLWLFKLAFNFKEEIEK